MDGNSVEELNEIIRDALYEVIEDLLKTKDFKVNVQPGSKKGLFPFFIHFNLAFVE